jgi:hypothetical protein
LIRNGLFLGILRPSSKDRKDAIRGQTYPVIYVSVFMETPTKVNKGSTGDPEERYRPERNLDRLRSIAHGPT